MKDNTINEAYCSFKVAKFLKENGFDEPCRSYYELGEPRIYVGSNGVFLNSLQTTGNELIARPTHQMTCAWLREKKNIFIEVGVSIVLNGGYHYTYYILNKECKYAYTGSKDTTYEDAVEAALEYALTNLI